MVLQCSIFRLVLHCFKSFAPFSHAEINQYQPDSQFETQLRVLRLKNDFTTAGVLKKGSLKKNLPLYACIFRIRLRWHIAGKYRQNSKSCSLEKCIFLSLRYFLEQFVEKWENMCLQLMRKCFQVFSKSLSLFLISASIPSVKHEVELYRNRKRMVGFQIHEETLLFSFSMATRFLTVFPTYGGTVMAWKTL